MRRCRCLWLGLWLRFRRCLLAIVLSGSDKRILVQAACQHSHHVTSSFLTQMQGYSGSDMRNLIQEACQGPVREAVVAAGGERVAQLRGEDLRPVRIRDFQAAAKVCWSGARELTQAEVQQYEKYIS